MKTVICLCRSHTAEKSLLDVLELNDSMNDIFSNQRLTGILSNIAYDEDGVISVSPEGIYQMGVLCGTITGEHVAGFLGTRARERNRQEHIKACREKNSGTAEYNATAGRREECA